MGGATTACIRPNRDHWFLAELIRVHDKTRARGRPPDAHALRAVVEREVAALRGVEVMQRTDGALLALFSDRWRLEAIERMNPHLTLEPLVAGRG